MSPEFLTQIGEFLTTLLSFVIFFWVMKKFAWGPLIQILDERARRIEDGFTEIQQKQAAAGQLERQYQEQIRNIDQERRTRVQEGIAEGRRVAAELTEQARAEAVQITERAQRTVQLEIAKGRQQLREELIGMTLQASERLLRERLDEAQHRKLVGAFIDELEQSSAS